MNFASASYGVACVLFGALGLGASLAWRRGLAGLWLTPTLFASAIWSALLAVGEAESGIASTAVFVAGVVRSGLWLVVLTRLLRPPTSAVRRDLLRAALLAPLAVLALGAVPTVLRDVFKTDSGWALPAIPGELVLALLALLLIEEAYRHADAGERWAIKYLLLGCGAMQAFDLLHAADWYAFGATSVLVSDGRAGANLLGCMALAVGLRRLNEHRPPAQINQGAVIYSGAVIAIGGYLACVAMAVVGIRAAGIAWGASLQALVVTTALLGLVAALSSAQLRAWAKVWLAKTFAPYRYDYRAEWLRLMETLTGEDGSRPLAERALRAVMQIVHSPSGGVWARDDDGQYVPVAGELSTLPGNTARSDEAWIRFVETREWVLDLSAPPPPMANALELPAWLSGNPRAWLVVPLLRGPELEGFIVVAHSLAPRAPLSWEDLDLLKITGRQVAAFLALENVARRLTQSEQFDAYHRFAAFMMHDLKNIAAQLALVVQNAETHRSNPDFIADAIVTVDNAARRMQRLLDQFRRGEESAGASRINVVETCRLVVARCASSKPRPILVASANVADAVLDAERLAHVIEHVVRNAQQATPESGSVTVAVSQVPAMVVVEVTDTGCGMDQEFVRDRLFRPFQSTKGSHGMGIGAYQTREFVRAAGGTLKVSSAPGRGTTFRIELPAAAPREARRISGGALG